MHWRRCGFWAKEICRTYLCTGCPQCKHRGYASAVGNSPCCHNGDSHRIDHIVQDELGFRMSAFHRRDGGYIEHDSAIPGGVAHNDSGYRDSDVLRAALTFAPVSSLKITPSMLYQHIFWNDVPTFDPGSQAYPTTMTANWSTWHPTFSNVDAGRLACCKDT
jgi:hypothetical protein